MFKNKSWGSYFERPDYVFEMRLKEGFRTVCSIPSFSIYCLEGILMVDQPQDTSPVWIQKGGSAYFGQQMFHTRIWGISDARFLLVPIDYKSSLSDDVFPAGGMTPENEHKAALALYAEKFSAARVLDLDQAAVICTGLKIRKQIIGFCNGCFDIFHAGHVELLMQAKSRCDSLFVAINTDESVKSLKGPNRPIISLPERIRVVSAIRYVDYIIPNGERTCLHSLEVVKPDIYVTTEEKGTKGPEAQKMISLNKPVEVISMISVFHSSEIAQKMKSF